MEVEILEKLDEIIGWDETQKRAYPGNFVAVDKLPLNTALCVDYFTTIKKFSSTQERKYRSKHEVWRKCTMAGGESLRCKVSSKNKFNSPSPP